MTRLLDDLFVRFLLIVPGGLLAVALVLVGFPVWFPAAWLLFVTIGLDLIRDRRR